MRQRGRGVCHVPESKLRLRLPRHEQHLRRPCSLFSNFFRRHHHFKNTALRGVGHSNSRAHLIHRFKRAAISRIDDVLKILKPRPPVPPEEPPRASPHAPPSVDLTSLSQLISYTWGFYFILVWLQQHLERQILDLWRA
jgi:hypothetical protein